MCRSVRSSGPGLYDGDTETSGQFRPRTKDERRKRSWWLVFRPSSRQPEMYIGRLLLGTAAAQDRLWYSATSAAPIAWERSPSAAGTTLTKPRWAGQR